MAELKQLEEGLLDEDDQPIIVRKVKCWPIIVMSSTTILFLFLWLSESQVGEGILRNKNVGEECGFRLIHDLHCSPGLECHYNRCQIPECPKCNHTVIFSNRTEPCPQCPKVHPKTVSYYDFIEKPNHWLDPGTHGFYKTTRYLQYGSCKALCASQKKCKAVSYQGLPEMCYMMEQYHLPPSRNESWGFAIKVI